MIRRRETREPIGLHDILVAWQAGHLPYRRALALTGMSAVTELYEAAANSGVEIRTRMLPSEERAARRATEALMTGRAEGYAKDAMDRSREAAELQQRVTSTRCDVKVDLTPDAAHWVQAEIESGRFATAEDVVRDAIVAAKLTRLRAELAAAEAEGGSFSAEEVRRFARQHLDDLTETSAPDR